MPSHETSRETLLRRVSLDLTGLPPTLAELDAFLADTAARRLRARRRPPARLAALRRALGAPVARPRALRRQQRLREGPPAVDVAVSRLGDRRAQRATCRSTSSRSSRSPATCCPSATREQRIATGFHRNAMTNEEGGVDPDEALYEVLRRSRQHDGHRLARQHARLRAVPQPQVRPVQPEGLLPADGVLRQHRRTSAEAFGDGTRYFESVARPRDAGAGGRAQELRAQLEGRRGRAREGHAGACRARRPRWEADVREAGDGVDAAGAEPRDGHQRRRARPCSRRRQRAGQRAEPAAHDLHGRRRRPRRHGVTGLRLEALLDPSLPKQGPGRDPYGHFRVTEPAGVRRAASDDPAKRTRGRRSPTVKGDGNVVAWRPGRSRRRKRPARTRGAAGRGWSMPCATAGACRSSSCSCPRRPFGFPGGTVLTVAIGHEDGTLGQGLGPLPPVGDDAPATRCRWWPSTPARAPRSTCRSPARTAAQAKDLATHFRGPVAAVRGRARRTSARLQEGARRSEDAHRRW